jgi:DNA-binding NarL/FixJ family response regulator
MSPEMNCNYDFISCEDAISTIKSERLDPEIILLDIGLPGMSGIDGIPILKNNAPSSKIIMLTIQDDNQSIFKAICNGASGYLLKDSDSDKIISAVKEVLAGGAPMNSSIAFKVLEMFKNFIPEKKDYNLSSREIEILQQLVEGLPKKIIADRLSISYHTVDSHLRKIYEKLMVHSASSAVAKALKENLI